MRVCAFKSGTMNGKITVVIADDHLVFREGLKDMLSRHPEIVLKAEASNGKELLLKAKQYGPEVIITDVKMPYMDGIETTKKLCRTFPGARIIALSSFSEDHLIIDMLEAGAQGFLLKGIQEEELITAIKAVYDHKPYFSPDITEKLTRIIAGRYHHKKGVQHVALTEIEKQIVVMICRELTSKEIAERLEVGKRTIESYRMRIMDKLGAKSVASIITYALRAGLIRRTS
jgi:DNA-binding NarL/FixJ family response regulator